MTRGLSTDADNLSSRTALGGDGGGRDMQSGSRGAHDTQRANSEFLQPRLTSGALANLPPLPAALYSRGVPLKASNALQALLDVAALIIWKLFLGLLGGAIVGVVGAVIFFVGCLIFGLL